ncbi:putative ent-kaurene synthase [Helianthus anomalus]
MQSYSSLNVTYQILTVVCVRFALGPIVLPAIYFAGPKLSKEIVESFEHHYLYELRSI